MLFWIAVIIMSSVVVAAIVWPLLRARQDSREEADFDIEVFRDQLAEVVREHGEGRLEYAEAEAAKAEISRRILAADAARRQRSDANTRQPAVAIALAVLLSVVRRPHTFIWGRPVSHLAPLLSEQKNASTMQIDKSGVRWTWRALQID